MKYEIQIVFALATPRAVELYECGELVDRTLDNSNLIAEPCDPPCEGMRSYCCDLSRETVYRTDLIGRARTMFGLLEAGLLAADQPLADLGRADKLLSDKRRAEKGDPPAG